MFVWSVWSLSAGAALWLVANYGRNLPFWDDWEMVPALTGAQPVTPAWLWSQHNEHRPMLPRLIMAGLFRAVRADFRLPRYVNAGLLSAMAAAMLLVARRIRGIASISSRFSNSFIAKTNERSFNRRSRAAVIVAQSCVGLAWVAASVMASLSS